MLKQTILSFTIFLFALTATAQLNLNLSANYVFPPSRGECSDIWGYVDTVGNEYALVGVETGLSIVDVTDPTSPEEKIALKEILTNLKKDRDVTACQLLKKHDRLLSFKSIKKIEVDTRYNMDEKRQLIEGLRWKMHQMATRARDKAQGK